jgi:hypothetical protein
MENEIIKRIERLEKAVFGTKDKPVSVISKQYKGATGGIRLLISNGFFDKKKNFGEIRKGLSDKDYTYGPQAIQTPLNKMSKPGGLLVAFKESGKKIYAKRK